MASNRLRGGFTIIEMLTAMVVLIFIVLMMTRIFTETTGIWTRGAKNVQSAVEGRVIMDFISKEMTQAIADDVVTFKLNSGGGEPPLYGQKFVFGAESDEVCFVGMVRSGDSGYRRTGNQFVYFISSMLDENNAPIANRYRLVRTRRTQSMYSSPGNIANSAYGDREWWRKMDPDIDDDGPDSGTPIETIAENVAGFEVWAWSQDRDDYDFGYNSAANNNLLPQWVDIYLELLGESEAIRAAILWSVDPDRGAEYIAQNVKRYTTRVFFPNRERATAF